MKHLRYLLMAALVAMPLVACDEDDDGGTTPTDVVVTGTVSGTVSIEGTGVAGVTVTLVGATSQTATTGSGGGYSFASVEAGSYGVTISNIPTGATFAVTSATTSITTQGQTVTVDFSGQYIRTSSIAGQVMAGGEGVGGVSVTATGPEGTSNAVTDNGGNFSFSGLRAGNYTVTITNVPEGYTFATTSNQVTVGTGEAKTVSFFGTKEAVTEEITATVLIKSVTAGPTNLPVNPAAVAAQIDVTVQVDPGTNSLSKLCVLVDGDEVPNGCQTLSSVVAGEGERVKMLQGGMFEVVFSILTATFTVSDGVATPMWYNGNHLLSARADINNSTEGAKVETSMELTFLNANVLLASWTIENSVTGLDARVWVNGDLTQTMTPVLYWEGAEIAQMFFTPNNNCGGGAPVTKTVTAPPWAHTYPDTRDPDQSTSGGPGIDGCEVLNMPFVVTSRLVGGGNGPGGTWTLNVDDVAPGFTNMQWLVNSTMWINEDYTFKLEPASGSWPTVTDGGSGFDGTVTFECGTSSSTLAPCTSGADLEESFDNTAYIVRAKVTDLSGNSNTRYWNLSSAGTTSSSSASTFGVDHGDPTITQLTTSPALRNKDIINTRTVSQVSYSDALSGFSPNPVWTRVMRYAPGVTGSSTCAVGDWDSDDKFCYMVDSPGIWDFNTMFTLPPLWAVDPAPPPPTDPYDYVNGTLTDAYYSTEFEARDQALNETGEVEWMNVRDATPPVNGGVANDADLDPGKMETWQALVVDNLDLKEGRWYIVYNDGITTDHQIHQATNAIGAWGPDAYTTSATATYTGVFVGSLEFGLGGGIQGADEAILDLYDFGHTGAASSSKIIGAENPFNVTPPPSFGAGTADVALTGASFGAANYGTGNTSLCSDLDFDGCLAATSSESATLTFAVTGAGSAQVLPAPLQNQFRSVTFYARAVNDADGTDPIGGATDRWFKIGTGVVQVTEDATGNVRTYSYSTTITGSQFGDSGPFTLLVVGANADGAGLVYAQSVPLNVTVD